jgi:predicted ribosome quality control (RQC) complex YloA/Tae2 family protein
MFDAITLAAVADELNEKVSRGRVQQVVQLDALSFGLEIYSQHARHYVYMTAHPEDARIHLVAEKLRGSGETPSGFLLLLRKYAEGAFVDSVATLPHERVLRIQFDHSVEGVTTLVVETIGRYSNLILVDAGGRVIDALKRIGPQVNRARVTLPKQEYSPPPPQSKLDPSTLTAPTLARALGGSRVSPLWQVLVKSIAGVSPLLAREVAFRLAVFEKSPNREADQVIAGPAQAGDVLAILAQLSRAPWEPSVGYEMGAEGVGESAEPAAFAPYRLTQYPVLRSYDSISAAIEAFYGALESYGAAKEPLREMLLSARERLTRRRDALAQSLPTEQEVEQLRTSGELVLAYASQVEPGQRILKAESAEGVVEIPLDPKLSAVENAQRYFRQYHRAKDSAARIPPLLEAAEAEVQYADQMLNDLELAENRGEIDAVIAAAREAGFLPTARPAAKPSGAAKGAAGEPRVFQSRDGFTILVGRNAHQNEDVTFRRAQPEDLWLHAREAAGAHVVILKRGREIPESTIREAGQLAAYYSQARGDSRVDVIVTERRHVRRARGGRTGMVTVRNARTLSVRLAGVTQPVA